MGNAFLFWIIPDFYAGRLPVIFVGFFRLQHFSNYLNLIKKIIGLYGLGMSYRDISGHIKKLYDTDISHTVLSQITDQIIPDVKALQSRPLEPLYCIVWLDVIHYKVKVYGRITHKALYNILGITKEGHKEVLGMYISESESANF